MGALNMPNRTLGIMDNLRFLRSLNNECVDLIAIDPPFAANETFVGRPRPPISDDEIAEEKALARKHGANHDEGRDTRVRDIWSWDVDVHPDWLSGIQDDYPPVFDVIKAVESCATENEAAYIAFMAVRLIECRRVLKPTGSIYVHCDDHANSYLRMLMDAVFGADNYRNQITWRRAVSHNDARKYGRIVDTLLFYSKSEDMRWNGSEISDPKSDDELARSYPSTDERGRFRGADLTGAGASDGESGEVWRSRFRSDNLTGAGASEGESGESWRGYDVSARGRHWAPPKASAYAEYIEREFIPGYRDIEGVHARLDALDAAGLIHHPKRGVWPGLKRYADADQGNPPQSLILNPTGFTNYTTGGGEFTGYSTQKPLSLYERLIRASSNPGDVVLDIFAGCDTTAVAAERLGRRWIACDMAYRSWTMLKRRFALNGFALSDMSDATTDALARTATRRRGVQPELRKAESRTIGPGDLPKRDDSDPDPFHNLRPPAKSGRGRRSSVRSASWSGRISKEEAKALLVEKFGPYCWGCGWEPPKFPNGEYDLGLLEVDHIWAKNDAATAGGGSDELYNLALLHPTCNRTKGNRLTLEELRRKNADEQRLYRNMRDLVHIGEAQQFAHEYILRGGYGD